MRFMMIMIPNIADEADWTPDPEAVATMSRYNEELTKAGVLLGLDGLHPAAKGARVGVLGRRGHSHRRAVHRGQGAHRRLLADPGEVEGGGGRVGLALPRRRRRRDRGPPGLGDVGIPARGPGRPRGERRRAVRVSAAPEHRAIEAVWRIESAALIAGLARIVRDVGLAEDLAQDALVAALERWPESGVPDNPGAWLMATAKHRAIDLPAPRRDCWSASRGAGPRAGAPGRLRRGGARGEPMRTSRRRPAAPDVHVLPSRPLRGGARGADTAPARRPEHRGDRAGVPRVRVDGRSADRPRQAHARRGPRPVRSPGAQELAARPPRCWRSLYLIFNEGYTASGGEDWMRAELCEEALRLGRILAGLAPGGAGGARPGRADGDPGLASGGRASAPTESRCCCSTRTARAGTGC